jgi:hypothetical protein
MSYIAVGVTAAGVVASVASKAMEKKGGGAPAFDYRSAENELGRLKDQIAERDKWSDQQVEERARQRAKAGDERHRQADFRDESNAWLGTQINRYNDVPGQLDGRAKQLGDYFAAHSGGMPTGVMPAASGQTAEHEAQRLAEASAFNTQQNNAQGAVRSFGDVWGDIGRESLGDKTKMTNVLDYKQGSRALLPGEMTPAVNRQAPQITAGNFGGMYGPEEEPDNTMSDILGGVGSIATSYGMSGMGGMGGSPFGAGGGFSTGLDGYGMRGMPKFGGPR